MSRSVAESRKWKKPREIAPDIPLPSIGDEGIRQSIEKAIKQYPHLILSVVYIPSTEELRAWKKEGKYDGVLLIYDPVKGYENGIFENATFDEVLAIGKSFYNITQYPYELPTRRDLQRFRQLTFVDGALIIFDPLDETEE